MEDVKYEISQSLVKHILEELKELSCPMVEYVPNTEEFLKNIIAHCTEKASQLYCVIDTEIAPLKFKKD